MTTTRLTLPPTPASVSAARRFVVDVLLTLGAEDACDDAATLVSELATNAVLHARTPFTVEVAVEGGAVHIGVVDLSPALPRVRDYGTDATTGRGMRMVDTMSSRWGVLTSAPGKVVWFELPVEGTTVVPVWDEDTDAIELLNAFADEDDASGQEDVTRAMGWAA